MVKAKIANPDSGLTEKHGNETPTEVQKRRDDIAASHENFRHDQQYMERRKTGNSIFETSREYRDLHMAEQHGTLFGPKKARVKKSVRDFTNFLPLKLRQSLNQEALDKINEAIENFQNQNPSGLAVSKESALNLMAEIQQSLEGNAQYAELHTKEDTKEILHAVAAFVRENYGLDDQLESNATRLDQNAEFQSNFRDEVQRDFSKMKQLATGYTSSTAANTINEKYQEHPELLHYYSRTMDLAEKQTRLENALQEWQRITYQMAMVNRHHRGNIELIDQSTERVNNFRQNNQGLFSFPAANKLFDQVAKTATEAAVRDSLGIDLAFDSIKNNLDRKFEDADSMLAATRGLNSFQMQALTARLEGTYDMSIDELIDYNISTFRSKTYIKVTQALTYEGEAKDFQLNIDPNLIDQVYGCTISSETVTNLLNDDPIIQASSLIPLYLKSDTMVADLYKLKQSIGDENFAQAIALYEEQSGTDLSSKFTRDIAALHQNIALRGNAVQLDQENHATEQDLLIEAQLIAKRLIEGNDISENEIAGLGYAQILLTQTKLAKCEASIDSQHETIHNLSNREEMLTQSYGAYLDPELLKQNIARVRQSSSISQIANDIGQAYYKLGIYRGMLGDHTEMSACTELVFEQEKEIQDYLAELDPEILQKLDIASIKNQAMQHGSRLGVNIYNDIGAIGEKFNEDKALEVLEKYSGDSALMSLLLTTYEDRYDISLREQVAEEFSKNKYAKAEAFINGDQAGVIAADLMIEKNRFFGPRDAEVLRLTSQAKMLRLEEEVGEKLTLGRRAGTETGLKGFIKETLKGNKYSQAIQILSSKEVTFSERAQLALSIKNTDGFWSNDSTLALQLLSTYASQSLAKADLQSQSGDELQEQRKLVLQKAFDDLARDFHVLHGTDLEQFITRKFGGDAEKAMLALMDGKLDEYTVHKCKFAIEEKEKDLIYDMAFQGNMREALIKAYGSEEAAISKLASQLGQEHKVVLTAIVATETEDQYYAQACRDAVTIWRNVEGMGTKNEQQIVSIVESSARHGTLEYLEQVFNSMDPSSDFETWVKSDLRDSKRYHFDVDLAFKLADKGNNTSILNSPDLMMAELIAKQGYYEQGIEIFSRIQKKEMEQAFERFKKEYDNNRENLARLRELYLQATGDSRNFIEAKEADARIITDVVVVGATIVVVTGTAIATGGLSLAATAAIAAGTSLTARTVTKTALLGGMYWGSGDQFIDVGISAVDGAVTMVGGKVAMSAGKHLGLARYGAMLEQSGKAGLFSSTSKLGGMETVKQIVKSGTQQADEFAEALGKEVAKRTTQGTLKVAATNIDDVIETATYGQIMRAAKQAGLKQQLTSAFADTAFHATNTSIRRNILVSGYIEFFDSCISAPAMGAFYTSIDANTWKDGVFTGLGRVGKSAKDMFVHGMAFAQSLNILTAPLIKLNRLNRMSRVLTAEQVARQINKQKRNGYVYGNAGMEYLEQQLARKQCLTVGDLKVARNMNSNTTRAKLNKLQEKYDYQVSHNNAYGKKKSKADQDVKRKRAQDTEGELKKRPRDREEPESKAKRKKRLADDQDAKLRRKRKYKDWRQFDDNPSDTSESELVLKKSKGEEDALSDEMLAAEQNKSMEIDFLSLGKHTKIVPGRDGELYLVTYVVCEGNEVIVGRRSLNRKVDLDNPPIEFKTLELAEAYKFFDPKVDKHAA